MKNLMCYSVLFTVLICPFLVDIAFGYSIEHKSGLISSEHQDTIKEKSRIDHMAIGTRDLKSAPKEKDPAMQDPNHVFEQVEIGVAPRTGFEAFRKWVNTSVQFSEAAKQAKLSGILKVSFIVEKNGSLTDFKIIEDLGHGTAQSVIKTLETSTKWHPAINYGRPVRSRYIFAYKVDLSASDVAAQHTPVNETLGSYAVIREAKIQRDGKLGNSNIQEPPHDKNHVYESSEIAPSPIGGMNNFRKWITENYPYPSGAIDAGVKGTISVSFIVEKNGRLSDIKILKDIGYGTGKAALDVMKKVEKWNPGQNKGEPVRVRYIFPIRLDLSER